MTILNRTGFKTQCPFIVEHFKFTFMNSDEEFDNLRERYIKFIIRSLSLFFFRSVSLLAGKQSTI